MNTNEKMITPQDVFVTILEGEEQSWNDSTKQTDVIIRNRPSGNEFMDKLAELLNIYKMSKASLYEEKMGVSQGVLSHFTMMYSGMNFPEWRKQYVMLAAKELLLETKYNLRTVGQRLGYANEKTFSKWFTTNQNESPSDWRRYAKYQQSKQDKELLAKIKQERRIELLTK